MFLQIIGQIIDMMIIEANLLNNIVLTNELASLGFFSIMIGVVCFRIIQKNIVH